MRHISRNLLRDISSHNMVPSSGMASESLTPIESGTCPGRLWVASAIPEPSSHILQASVCSDAGARAWRFLLCREK